MMDKVLESGHDFCEAKCFDCDWTISDRRCLVEPQVKMHSIHMGHKEFDVQVTPTVSNVDFF